MGFLRAVGRLFGMGSGIIMVANKTKVLNGKVTTCLTGRNTGIIILSEDRRTKGTLMSDVGTRNGRTVFLCASMVSGRMLRNGGIRVVGTCNHVSMLLGTTNNGVTNTAVTPSGAFFSLRVSTFGGMMSLGLFNAILPAVMFTRVVMRRGGNSVMGFYSRSTLHPLAHMMKCNTTGTTVTGFAGCVTNRLTLGFNGNLHMGTVTPNFFLARRGHALLAGPSNSLASHSGAVLTRAPFGHFNRPRSLCKAVRCLVDSTSGFMANAMTIVSNNFSTFSVWFVSVVVDGLWVATVCMFV